MGFRLVAVDHVQLAMPGGQEEKANGFYSGILGLARQPKPESLASRGGCWFTNGDVVIHLGVDPDFRPARKAHPGLVVDDLAACEAALAAAGHEVTPDENLHGVRRSFVHDPFGNRIELIQEVQPD